MNAQDNNYTLLSKHLTVLQLNVSGSSVPTLDINSRHISQLFSKQKASDTTKGDLQRQEM